MRPGRADMTTTRSARKIASEIECVTKAIVLRGLHPDFLDQQIHFVAREGVEGAERLIHQQHGGVDREASDDRGALLHAAGEFARKFVLEALQIDAFEQMRNALIVGPATFDLKGKSDVLEQIAPGQQVGVLEDHRDFGMRLRDPLPPQPDFAVGQSMQPAHRPEQRRLAASRRTEDAQEFALANFERNLVQSMHGAGTGRIIFGR